MRDLFGSMILKGAQTKARIDDIITQAAAATNATTEEVAYILRCYMARNQSDSLIHKRLKEALDDDLDIFVKTEVLNADQLLAEDAGNIPDRAIRVARVIRQIGRRINTFLGVLEDFQKRLWEKKKLVLSTRYVITLDWLDKLRDGNLSRRISPRFSPILRKQQNGKHWDR